MAGRRLSRWHKGGAIVPLAALVGVWGAALAGPGVAVSSSDGDDFVPEVPEVAISQPASIQGDAGLDPQAGVEGTLDTLSTSGIPEVALSAYRRAELLLSQADESCNLQWNLVAAIGRVESNHGRINGSSLDSDGNANPPIYGIPLDGTNGTARISDTDGGALDGDDVWDRAVGPMQFIPGTWDAVGLDANGDGEADPQNVYDAAVAAGVYLCAGDGDLSTRDGASEALFRYNRSQEYVQNVLAISDAYEAGDFSQVADGYSAAPALTSRENDQTLSEAQRDRARTDRLEREREAQREREREREASQSSGGSTSTSPNTSGSSGSSGGGTGGSSGGGTGGSGGGGSTGGGGGSSSGGGSGGGSSSGGSTLRERVDETGQNARQTVRDTLTYAEARVRCNVEVPPPRLSQSRIDAFQACIARLT